jgi:hypothetical protein
MYEICEELYEDSVKCNERIPYTSYYYDEEWEQTKNRKTCAFMEAIQKGNIDKYGYVHLSRNYFFSGLFNKVNNDVLPQGYYLTDNQFFFVFFASLVCIGLAVQGHRNRTKIVNNKELKTTLV